MSLSYAARANKYAREVLSGKIPACIYVRQACQRHLDDLAQSKDKSYPYYFDTGTADRICSFAENMVHVKGKWALESIRLEAWQIFLFAVAFGWLRHTDNMRRFREIYWEIPRKNGKSLMGAIIGLYMAFADTEAAAEVFSGATSEKQAWKVFWQARQMCLKSEEFREHFGIYVGAKNLCCLDDGSKFEPIIGDPGDGDSPHCAIIDEYHEHKKSNLYDTMKTGMGARTQPMRVVITTAGMDTSTPCYAKHDDSIKILAGVLQDDETFPCIFTIDPDDDWTLLENWKKANPNYGVSVFEDFLEARRQEAMVKTGEQNELKCKHLNVWSSAGVAWINILQWRKNIIPMTLEELKGQPCIAALDLASKIDLVALVFMFKFPEYYYFFGRYYLPENTVDLPANRHYQKWRDEGHLIVTPGARTDFHYVKDDLLEHNKTFPIKELAYDPHEAAMLIQEIEEEASFPCIEVMQSAAQISEPMKELEALYMAGNLHHDGNPILNWTASNVVLKSTRTKLFYPAKERPENKIDPIVAAIMALKRAMIAAPTSVYEERGILFV
ncbi:terminase large subunit [Candidatus Parcubacteria bacterium]|nr:MAG: terminase large subunit [Candidatus Parcubacteria bacterium]